MHRGHPYNTQVLYRTTGTQLLPSQHSLRVHYIVFFTAGLLSLPCPPSLHDDWLRGTTFQDVDESAAATLGPISSPRVRRSCVRVVEDVLCLCSRVQISHQ